MFQRNRYRRTFSALPTASERQRPLRALLLVLLGVCIVLWGAWKLLQAVGILNQVQRMRVDFAVASEPVNISIEGGELQHAEEAKLYADDRIVSNSGGRATLEFFDGSIAGIDESSELTIEKSEKGTKESRIYLTLQRGRIFFGIPSKQSFSGSVVRMVDTGIFAASLPAGTRAIVSVRGIQVLEAEGLGVIVEMDDIDEPAYIGEGQQLVLPEGEITGSIYDFRSAIDPAAARLAILLGDGAKNPSETGSGSDADLTGSDLLLVRTPTEGQQVTSGTVQVQGQVGPTIQRVRINGHDARIDQTDGSFTQELAVTAGGASMDILVEALDSRDVVIAQESRTISLQAKPVPAPTITSPAKDGSVYRTSQTKFEIRGTAPAGATGIMVNDYKLQLFKQGDAQWVYLVNAELGNLVAGRNDFTVTALDSAGTKGPGVTLTILYEAGQEGVVSSAGSSTAATSSVPEIAESTLPQNAPLTPGILSITAPSDGSPYTATSNDILIEGKTGTATASVWVNGYRLQLYKPGATFWNYIAREAYGTLKKGRNTYVVNARNANNEILDTLTYEINY